LNHLIGLWNLDLCGEFDELDRELIREELASTLLTTERAATELLRGGAGACSEEDCIVYYFYSDLCSRVGQTILNFKRGRDVNSESCDVNVSSITQMLCGIVLTIMLSAMVVLSIMTSINISGDLSDQQAWIFSFLLGLMLDMIVNSTVVVMIYDVYVPLFIMPEVFHAKMTLLDCIEQLNKLSLHPNQGLKPSALDFNAADYFFISKRLSKIKRPHPPPRSSLSSAVGLYHSIKPKASSSSSLSNRLKSNINMATLITAGLNKLVHLHPLVQDSILRFFVSIFTGLFVVSMVYLNTDHQHHTDQSWLIPLIAIGIIGMMVGGTYAYIGQGEHARRAHLSQHRTLLFLDDKLSLAPMTAKSDVRLIKVCDAVDNHQSARIVVAEDVDGGIGEALRDDGRPTMAFRDESRPAMKVDAPAMDGSITLFHRSILLHEWASKIQTLSAECSASWLRSENAPPHDNDIEEGFHGLHNSKKYKKYALCDNLQPSRGLGGLRTIEENEEYKSDIENSKLDIYLLSDSDDCSIPLSTNDKVVDDDDHGLENTKQLRSDTPISLKYGDIRLAGVYEAEESKMDFDSDFGESIDLSSSSDDDDRSIPLSSSSSDDDDSIVLSSDDNSIFLSIVIDDDDDDDDDDDKSIELSCSSSDDSNV